MAAEESLQLGWPLEGLVTRSPRVTRAAVLWALSPAPGK